MIEAQGLHMQFGNRVAVNGVSFTVNAGSVVGFLGPNGAGKSTTMRILVGYLKPRSGRALICGEDMGRNRRVAQACVGYLPEAADGFPNLTVREFLIFCGEARGIRGPALSSRIRDVCDQIELRPALSTKLGELSKGWRQRAWFAQSILHDPPVLIMDEPTDGLDPNQKEQVRALIQTMSSHKAILFSTHVLEEVEKMCTRAIIVVDGRVVADDKLPISGDESAPLESVFHRLTANVTENIKKMQ